MSWVVCPKCGASYENGIPPIEVSGPGWCMCPQRLFTCKGFAERMRDQQRADRLSPTDPPAGETK